MLKLHEHDAVDRNAAYASFFEVGGVRIPILRHKIYIKEEFALGEARGAFRHQCVPKDVLSLFDLGRFTARIVAHVRPGVHIEGECKVFDFVYDVHEDDVAFYTCDIRNPGQR